MIKLNLKIFFIQFFILLIIFLIDRITKIYILNLAEDSGNVDIYINSFLNLHLNWNTGIAFGLLSTNANLLYHLVSALILLIIAYLIYLMVIADNPGKIILSLIIGGAIGNLYDRLTYFAVPDFIDFHIHNFHWFTFNVADIFISLGIICLIFAELFNYKKD